ERVGGGEAVRRGAGTLSDGHFDATITGFGTDDSIDLQGIGTAARATLGAGNVLTLTGGTTSPVTLQLDPGQDFAGDVFHVVSDASGGTLLTIDQAPIFTSPANVSAAEDQTAAGTVTAQDPEHDPFLFGLAGGSDQSFFMIDAHSGALRFVSAPDFETPEDANHDNVYDVVVSATDSFGATSTQAIHVTVTDVAEAGKVVAGGNGNDTLAGTPGN